MPDNQVLIRLHTRKTYFDVYDMDYPQAAALHATGAGAFDVDAKKFGELRRRQSISVPEIVRVEWVEQ